jgi:nitrogen fixation protein NifQ
LKKAAAIDSPHLDLLPGGEGAVSEPGLPGEDGLGGAAALRRETAYAELKAHAAPCGPNGEWLARLLASWLAGEGSLPDCLGLEAEAFAALAEHYFPGVPLSGTAPSGRRIDFSRMLERDDLQRLLLGYAECAHPCEAEWLSDILVAGCMGSDHLWQDLGLWSRADLSGLIAQNFPRLAALNHRDMKWKKFLYKQLCEAEGIYVCRAPSCEVCIDYPKCFGSEE